MEVLGKGDFVDARPTQAPAESGKKLAKLTEKPEHQLDDRTQEGSVAQTIQHVVVLDSLRHAALLSPARAPAG